jgi:hypothetical protein
MTTKTKKRQELYLDTTHPNYAELTNAGLSERDTCEFYLTSDGKAIAFHFDSLDEYMKYLSKLQGSRVEVELMYGLLGWKYTDSFCLDNRPDGEGWVKFDVLTYHDELLKMGLDNMLNINYHLVSVARNNIGIDIYFRKEENLRWGSIGIEMHSADRNQMECDGRYMGIVFNLEDVKP